MSCISKAILYLDLLAVSESSSFTLILFAGSGSSDQATSSGVPGWFLDTLYNTRAPDKDRFFVSPAVSRGDT